MSVACVASVSVGFSARSRHFSLFGGAKIGASAGQKAKNGQNVMLAHIMLETCGKPYGNAFYAG